MLKHSLPAFLLTENAFDKMFVFKFESLLCTIFYSRTNNDLDL